MKISFALIVCALVLGSVVAQAQEPRPAAPRAETSASTGADHEISLGKLTPTPEMWFYDQQLRLYRDPKMAVRRRAEFEADQRQMRLAAQRWFGFSNSRPTVNPVPYTGIYSPMWTSNGPYPYMWQGTTPATITVPVQPARTGNAYGLW